MTEQMRREWSVPSGVAKFNLPDERGRVCPLHALAGNSFSSPGMAVHLVDLALQYKGGKRALPFE